MNLADSINLRSLGDAGRGTARRHGGGRARLLMLTMKYTGLRSFHLEMQRYTLGRDDVEAVYVTYHPPVWVKALGAHVPGLRAVDFAVIRTVRAWQWHLSRWLRPGGRLDLRSFDAVMCTSQFMGLAAAGVRESTGCRVGVFMDSTTRNNIDDLGFGGRVHESLARLEKRLLDRVDVAACTSSWAARSLDTDYGVPRDRIVLCPPTTDVPAAIAPRPLDGHVRMIFIGNSFARKGGSELLRWHQERWRGRVELHVCSNEAVPDPAHQGVIYHGGVPRERLVGELLPTMHLFVMPTTSDQSCWPAVEAAAAGVPTIVTRIGGIPELVEDGVTGVLVSKGDEGGFVSAIERLLNDRARLAEMGRAAHAAAARRFERRVVFGPLLDRLLAKLL